MIDFIWKNEKATEHGIVVVSLPPISKAEKNVEIIEIDGRDGDIIIEKGFKSYDKEVEIGLARNYDLNWLMNWLDGTDKVTFSDEENVFYNATIIDQIDFEKLLSFKTAKIKFHVQPFKYLNNESKVVQSFSSTSEKKVVVNNLGLINSKPIITIYGTGTINLSINGTQCCIIELNDVSDYITLDSIQEEAFQDNLQTLRNRNMNGAFPVLKSGQNEITWTGNITKIEILPKSRWL